MRRKLVIGFLLLVGIVGLGIGLLGGAAPNLSAAFKSELASERDLEQSVYASGSVTNNGANSVTGQLVSKSSEEASALVSYELAWQLSEGDSVKVKFEGGNKEYAAEITDIASSPTSTDAGPKYLVKIDIASVPDRAKSGMTVQVDFADFSYGYANFQVSEYELSQVRVGLPVTVTPLVTGDEIEGSVSAIGTVPDSSTGVVTYAVTVKFTKPDSEILDGMSVAGKIRIEDSIRALAIPASAVSEVDGVTQVQVLTDGLPKTVEVSLGIEADGYVQVLDGLGAGDEVITGAAETSVSTGGFIPPAPGGN